MEEDIKMIEDVLKDKDIIFWIGTQGIKAIQNLIARNKELKEEVVFLRKHCYIPFKKEKTESYGELITVEERRFIDERECIPKSKIKEKIESISGLKNSKNYTEKILTNFVIDILEDLLED